MTKGALASEQFFFNFFFFGHATQFAGSQFPHQGLNPGHDSESLES